MFYLLNFTLYEYVLFFFYILLKKGEVSAEHKIYTMHYIIRFILSYDICASTSLSQFQNDHHTMNVFGELFLYSLFNFVRMAVSISIGSWLVAHFLRFG